MRNKENIESLKYMGHKIKNLRLNKGLSQDALATKSGLHRNYISQLERGVNNPSILNLRTLASGLGVEVEIIIKDMFPVDLDSSKAGCDV